MPDIPDYQIVRKIGEGAYGEIWLGISITGVYRAIKFIRRDKFEHERPYEREFNGIKQYEPVSREHEGLVDILHIGRNEEEGYFYYVMELSDDQHTGQEINPATYKPKTLRSELTARENLPIPECLKQGAHLARALAHLHACGLAHRDVKPANIIYVKGKPRLADIGLVKALDDSVSFAGTIGYVPLEGPGRPTGDVFSLGKVLYEMLTGMDRTEFPSLPDSFKDDTRPGLQKLNQIVFKACEHKPDKRYQKADQLAVDLEQLIGQDLTTGRAPPAGSLPVGKLVAALAAVALVIFGINQFKGMKSTGEEISQPVASAGPDKYAHLKKGLVAYYPFNGNAKDESGNGNDGKVNGATLVADRHGKKDSAYRFDGLDDDILVEQTKNISVEFEDQITLSAWIKAADARTQEFTIIRKGTAEKYDLGLIIEQSNEIDFGMYTEDVQVAVKAPAHPSEIVDKWTHVMAVRDSTNMYVYLNGRKIGQKPISGKMINRSPSFTIGSIDSSGLHFAKGLIDDVRIYNRALSDQEVKKLHEMEKPQPKTVASVGSKATTPGTFDLADLMEKNGIYHHKDTGKPVTGRIVAEHETDRLEFNLKDGIKHGPYQRWHTVGHNGRAYVPLPKEGQWPAEDSIFKMGVMVKHQRWWNYDPKASWQLRLKVWEGTSSPWQIKEEGWNKDGTAHEVRDADSRP